jgi:Tfp pilus assembly protein FimT
MHNNAGRARNNRPKSSYANAKREINCRGFFELKTRQLANRQTGFSTIELVIVLAIFLLLAVIAIPQAIATLRAFRASSDARSVASELSLAKMRAGDSFTQSRLNCNLAANSCQIEICTSKGASACNTFSADGGTLLLSPGMTFGFGNIAAPAGTQTAIQNTAQIVFNSRGIPVDNTGTPTGNYALYLTNQAGDNYAVTVYATGRIAVWRYIGSAWTIQ